MHQKGIKRIILNWNIFPLGPTFKHGSFRQLNSELATKKWWDAEDLKVGGWLFMSKVTLWEEVGWGGIEQDGGFYLL